MFNHCTTYYFQLKGIRPEDPLDWTKPTDSNGNPPHAYDPAKCKDPTRDLPVHPIKSNCNTPDELKVTTKYLFVTNVYHCVFPHCYPTALFL